jgi:hypothetical protein
VTREKRRFMWERKDDNESITYVTRNSKVIRVFTRDTREITGKIIPWGMNFGVTHSSSL